MARTETVRAKGLPANLKLRVGVTPPPGDEQCSKASGFCASASISPAPGTPKFRTNGKGRATLTFVVRDHYDFIKLKNLTKRHPVAMVNGQTMLVTASGTTNRRRHGEKEPVLGFASAKAPVELIAPAPQG